MNYLLRTTTITTKVTEEKKTYFTSINFYNNYLMLFNTKECWTFDVVSLINVFSFEKILSNICCSEKSDREKRK
jgi:hypothetical protein